jgi:hypothetical protein
MKLIMYMSTLGVTMTIFELLLGWPLLRIVRRKVVTWGTAVHREGLLHRGSRMFEGLYTCLRLRDLVLAWSCPIAWGDPTLCLRAWFRIQGEVW